MGALPLAKAGAGSAVNDTTREVGGTLGVAIVGSVLNSAYGSHVLSALTALGAPAAAAHPPASRSSRAWPPGALPAPLRDAAERGAVRVHDRRAPRLARGRGRDGGRRGGGAGLRAGACGRWRGTRNLPNGPG